MWRMRSHRLALVCWLVAWGGALPAAAQPSSRFLMVQPGDPGATAERAAEFLRDFARYLGSHVAPLQGQAVAGEIANREAQALALLEASRPSLVFAPPGFYLEHLRDPALGACVVLSVPRFGKKVERYHLVAVKDSGPKSLDELRGKRVHGGFELDLPYLQRAVFPAGRGPPELFALQPSQNLADDVFSMLEGGEEEEPPDALLLDEGGLRFFADDDLVWPRLAVVWTSAELPRDLVVTVGGGWDDAARRALVDALTGMSAEPAGKRLLALMQSEGFALPDTELLARTAAAYDRGAEAKSEGKPPEAKPPAERR
jgi:ABC-type phosphate/phosphonate transport system substrate-binding protein